MLYDTINGLIHCMAHRWQHPDAKLILASWVIAAGLVWLGFRRIERIDQ